jgi:hypothetical protein
MRGATVPGALVVLGILLFGALAPHAQAAVPSPPGVQAATNYTPQVNDGLSYFESQVDTNAFGNISGFVENNYINGSLKVTAVSGAVVTVEWQWTEIENCNECSPTVAYDWGNGNFTFNDQNYSYANGNDLEAPQPLTIWFYTNNTDAAGASISSENTPLTVDSTDQSYPTSLSSTGYATTLFAEGTGTYVDNNPLGSFHATYSEMAYYDPTTGYVLGVQYAEENNDGAGDGYTYFDNTQVTSATFTPTSAAAPATDTVSFSTGSSGCPVLFNDGNYSSGQSATVQAGATYVISYYPSCGWTFNSWSTTAGTLGSSTAAPTLLTVTASGTLTASLSSPPPTPFPWGTVVVLLVLLFIFILLIVLYVRRHHRPRQSGMARHGTAGNVPFSSMPTSGYGGPAPLSLTPSDQPAVQQIVVKETVKVPCQYCGTLIDSTATACPKCGAPRS